MLTQFDWLRLCRSGKELLASMYLFRQGMRPAALKMERAAPYSALDGACHRCGWYARQRPGLYHCAFCSVVHRRSFKFDQISRRAVLIWGRASHLPTRLTIKRKPYDKLCYIHDDQNFLLALPRRILKEWCQELIIYEGEKIQASLQIFPTIGSTAPLSMGESLCWVHHHSSYFPLNGCKVRFHPSVHDTLKPHVRDRQGILSFDIADFVSLLDFVQVFRIYLKPAQQNELFTLLTDVKPDERHFYWGRFLGSISQDARDMLVGWELRRWPPERLRLLHDLLRYVTIPFSY